MSDIDYEVAFGIARTEIAQLRAENETMDNAMKALGRQLADLGRENERLKAALRSIEAFPYVGAQASVEIGKIARAALADEQSTKTDTDRFFSPRSKYTTTSTYEQVQGVQFTKGYFADQYEAGVRIDPATGEIINKNRS